MTSKAQGLSLNTIIIASLVLLVLLILVGLTTGYFGKRFNPTFGKLSDTSCNGRVIDFSSDCTSDEQEKYAADVPQGKKCCITTKDVDGSDCKSAGGDCVPYSACVSEDPGYKPIPLGDKDCPTPKTCCKF